MPYPYNADVRHSEGTRIADLLVEFIGILDAGLTNQPDDADKDPVALTSAVIDTATAIREASEQQAHSIAHLIAANDRATDMIVKAIDRTSGAGTDFGY